MLRVNAIARTVWVKDLLTEKRQGNNGDYDSKSILFRVATDRNYKRTVVKDGVQTEERPTDFILCRANGATAQVIADNCSAKDSEGKLISRHLGLIGHIETYETNRTFKVENLAVSISGANYNLNFDTIQKVDGNIFIVDEIEFLDKKPTQTVQVQGATVSNVTISAPVVQSAPVVAPTTAQVTQPVVQQQVNVANVVPTVVNNPAETMMAPPTMPEGYTGEGAPF